MAVRYMRPMNEPLETIPYARVSRARRGSWRVNFVGLLMCIALFGDVAAFMALPYIHQPAHDFDAFSRSLGAMYLWLIGVVPSGCATLVAVPVAFVKPLPRERRPESTQLRVMGYLAVINVLALIVCTAYAMWPFGYEK